MTTGSRKPGVFVKTAHHKNNTDNKNNEDNNNNNNYGTFTGDIFRVSDFTWEKK